jgi:hypothetical protein
MNSRFSLVPRLALRLAAALAAAPPSLWACATCFGRTDSKLAEGMNAGIFTLLGVVAFVLGGFAAFFVYLARRAASAAGDTPASVEAPAPNRHSDS